MTEISGHYEIGDKVYCPIARDAVVVARFFTEQAGRIERRYRVKYNTLVRNGLENVYDESWLIPAAAPIEAYFYLAAAWELPVLRKMYDRATADGRPPFASKEEIDKQERDVTAARAWLIQEGWIDE